MRRAIAALALAPMVLTIACQRHDAFWFKGDFAGAAAQASDRDTLVMVEFYTDWCSWCRRMEKDTFSKAEVRQQLADLVPLRLNAEMEGEELAQRYGVDSYPTFVFADPQGDEVDRILGYLPPERFVAQALRIRDGDTFVACLQRLSEEPADQDAIVRAVVGLLERSDPEGAISRIKAFHTATDQHDHFTCKQLMFKARVALQSRLYGRAARLYRTGWDSGLDVPDTDGTAELRALVAEGLTELDPEQQAARLRQARYADAGRLLEMVSLDSVLPEELFDIGDFAFSNGHYDVAAAAYNRWFLVSGEEAEADSLNSVAWQMYLAGRSLDTAVEVARQAYEVGPSADVSDTLARLLYVTGEVDEAIFLQRRAAELATGIDAERFREAEKRMAAGQDLGDRPGFEVYPGERLLDPEELPPTVI